MIVNKDCTPAKRPTYTFSRESHITLSCSSKTFFLGEYSALVGGPAIIVNTAPRFQLHILNNDNPQNIICRGINMHSPAGKFLKEYWQQLQYFGFEFRDPHLGHGGFGASSAQYLLCVAFITWLENNQHFTVHKIDPAKLIQQYIANAWDGHGLAPSGADLIGQLYGQITFYYKERNFLQKFNWPFPALDFLLVRTGHKTPTHQHLKNITTFPHESLQQTVFEAMQAFATGNPLALITVVNNYAKLLEELNFVAEETLTKLQKINAETPALAAKGCGALGADVILILVEKENRPTLNLWLQENNLNIVGTNHDLTYNAWIEKQGFIHSRRELIRRLG